jgi:hypothetical protein
MRKGKILKFKFGVNPNSSSIGADVTYLLMGAATLGILVNLIDVGIRVWFKKRM